MLRFSTLSAAVAAALALPALAHAAGDAAKGSALFKQRCGVCHVSTDGARATIAPNLFGVVGRKAGSTSFSYSEALKSSGLVWTPSELDSFLAAPTKTVSGTRMTINMPAAPDRADLIAYLSSLKR